MSNDECEGGNELLRRLQDVEDVARELKRAVAAAEDNEMLAASALIEEKDALSASVDYLWGYAASKGMDIFGELISLLDDFDQRQSDLLWERFRGKLNVLESTGTRFQKCCLFRTAGPELGEDKTTLIHEVCKKRPPVDVVAKLLQMIPPNKMIKKEGKDSYLV